MYALTDRDRRSSQPAILLALALAWTVFAFSTSPSAFAQSPESQTFSVQQRFLEEQIRPLIQPVLRSAAVEDRFQYDFGAILCYTGLWFEDHGPNTPFPIPGFPEFQGSRAAHDFDFRPWLALS